MKMISITLMEYLVRYAVKHFSGKARCGVAPNRYVRDVLKKNMARTGTTGKIMIRTCESEPIFQAKKSNMYAMDSVGLIPIATRNSQKMNKRAQYLSIFGLCETFSPCHFLKLNKTEFIHLIYYLGWLFLAILGTN